MTETAYDRHKERARKRQRNLARAGQDIGPPPAVVDSERRRRGFDSLREFAELYFASRITLAWSPDHLQVLARMQEATTHGGLFALAMPRGSGKTTLAEIACLWAVMTGRHSFVMLIAVSATRATQLLEGLKTELLVNDALLEDWPEVCHPIRELEDRANRAKGQHINGVPTYIGWRKSELVLPFVEGSQSSGAVLRVSGLTGGGIRGSKFTRPHDGQNVRPSLAIIDDPQDDDSARSLSQCETRHRLIQAGVLGMAGPGKKITAICPCTVIAPHDLASRLLDREQSPEWTGQRYKLLNRFPDRMDLWEEYATRRADELRNGGDGHLATAWYAAQKEVMDRGAVASWPERHQPDEAGAVQHALNLFFKDQWAFWAEYQNEPKEPGLGGGEQLKADDLVKRLNGLGRGVVPLAATRLTCYVDVQQKALYWIVAGWSDDFTGAVVDYGAYPDQKRPYFTLADVQRTLARAAPGAGLEGSIHAGLTALASDLLGREWRREDGTVMRVERLGIDANWGSSTDVIYEWCRTTPYATQALPCHGRYVGAASKPWSDYQKRPGERLGLHWLLTVGAGKRATRHLVIDSNYWKSFVAERLGGKLGDRGALTFFGREGQDHRLLADHLTAEYRVRTEGRGRQVDEWRIRPERNDNHWLHCLSGAAATASVGGSQLGMPGQTGPVPRTPTAKAKQDYEAKRKAFEKRRGY